MEVEMKIRDLMMDATTNMPVVVLEEVSGDSVLPIWVGIYEANAIALEFQRVAAPRPMTHDLIKILLMGLETGIQKVVLNELRDDTFYAVIWLECEGKIITVDSRPSDALALALRHDCPIYVEERVLQACRIPRLSQKEPTMKNCGSGSRTWMTKTLAAIRCNVSRFGMSVSHCRESTCLRPNY
jgi:uncharacterized protein